VKLLDRRRESESATAEWVDSVRVKADTRTDVRGINLTTVGGACAVLTTAWFVVGIVLMASSGVQTLIPDTGADNLKWIDDVDSGGDLFIAGAWLGILGGVFGLIALVCVYDTFRSAGPLMILAPVLAVVAWALVTISHLIPIAMANELVPGYVGAHGSTQDSLTVVSNTLAQTSLVINYTGDVLLWGVVVPMYAFAILRMRLIAGWIGWVGIVTAVFAGWLGLLSPLSSVIDGITFIGFVAFFVFMASMGIALLRRKVSAPTLPAAAH
jgi:hypothetical protein